VVGFGNQVVMPDDFPSPCIHSRVVAVLVALDVTDPTVWLDAIWRWAEARVPVIVCFRTHQLSALTEDSVPLCEQGWLGLDLDEVQTFCRLSGRYKPSDEYVSRVQQIFSATCSSEAMGNRNVYVARDGYVSDAINAITHSSILPILHSLSQLYALQHPPK
jgi:hypothetical protein